MRQTSVLKFIAEKDKLPTNGWFIYEDHISIYVRKGSLYINGYRLHSVFQISSVNIGNSERRHKGLFSGLLRRIELRIERYNYDAIYIENVRDKWFVDYFLRKGYTAISTYPHSSTCLFKIYNEEYLKDQIREQYND